jgi:ParB-like chromosome segregation protein Spo0J
MRKENKVVNISLLKTPEKNTRIHPEKQINEIRRSLRKWGQYKNAVVDENYLVLAGNGMVEAMRQEGMKKVSGIIMYELTENDKKKLMMADNKTAGLGVDNLDNIQEIINELAGDFDIPGFDDDVLASINAASEEISAALDDYGKATDENLAKMETHSNVNYEEDNNEPLEGIDTNTVTETETNQKPLICPHCSKEIWL